jgi:hypothetical protein
MPGVDNREPESDYKTVYKVFATCSDDRAFEQAFMASIGHLAAKKKISLHMLHGDGTNIGIQKGGTRCAYA